MARSPSKNRPTNWSKMKKADLVAELERRDAAAVPMASTSAKSDHLDIWQTLIDAIPAPIFYKNTDHIYLGCNRAFETYIGFSKDRVRGASVYDVAPKALADVYRTADDKLFAERGTQVYQAKVKYADGAIHEVMFHKAVYANPDGSLGGMVGIMLDITERTQAETALRESQLMFGQLVENLPDPIFVHDGDGEIIQVNDQACISLGYDRDQLLAMSVAAIEVGASPTHLKAAWAELSSEVQFFNGIHRRRDGTTFPVEANVSRLDLENRDAIYIASVRDVSERQKAEMSLMVAKQEAEAANQTKTEFLANMSHELRTPLNAILGFSDLIRDQMLGPIGTHAYLSYADDIHSSGAHLLQIINDLLDLSRLEIGDTEIVEETVTMDEIVDNSFRMLADAAEKGGLTLTRDIPEGLPKLRCDARRITQVLINLLSNAVKFTPSGGTVTTWSSLSESGELTLAVTDTGIGIHAKDLAKVMIPFEQLQNLMTRRHSGSGLGLALCKSLVETHDGRLSIDSTPGKGTTVSAVFPPERLVP